MIFGKEATKSPSEQYGSDQASKYNEGGESGIHRRIVTWLPIYCEINVGRSWPEADSICRSARLTLEHGIARTTKVLYGISCFGCLLLCDKINADPYAKWTACRVAGTPAP